jgi:hypothetical protein
VCGLVVEVERGRELGRDLGCEPAVDAVVPAVGQSLRRLVGVRRGGLEVDGRVPVALAVPMGCAQLGAVGGLVIDGIGAPGCGGASTLISIDLLADLPP